MHCEASFTMAFALKNHFDRGTCPVLLMNWVRDTHYGPKGDSIPSQPMHHDSVPLPTQGHHSTLALGLKLGTDRHSIMALRHPVHASIGRCIQFHPERRLLWYTFVMRWTIHFPDLPQVAFHLGSAPLIIQPLPLHWAWNSDCPDTWWDPNLINLDTHQHDQINWLSTAILELEHALARDFVLSPIASEHGRQYVHGRHVICRSPGHMPSPSQAPSHRDGVISGQSIWERQIETPIRLLNHLFEARRGYRAFDDVGQADPVFLHEWRRCVCRLCTSHLSRANRELPTRLRSNRERKKHNQAPKHTKPNKNPKTTGKGATCRVTRSAMKA